MVGVSNTGGPFSDPYGGSTGPSNPYSDAPAGNPYGSTGSDHSADPYSSAGPYGAGTASPYSTDHGPYTGPAQAGPPSGGYAAPYAGGGNQGYQPPGTYQPPGAYQPPGTYGGGGYGGYPPVVGYQNGAGGWSLGLGIAAIVLCLVPFLSQGTAIAAIITGAMGRKAVTEGRANNGGMALAGIIIGGVSLLISIIAVIVWIGTTTQY